LLPFEKFYAKVTDERAQ